jgi:hypothetical protein
MTVVLNEAKFCNKELLEEKNCMIMNGRILNTMLIVLSTCSVLTASFTYDVTHKKLKREDKNVKIKYDISSAE